MGTCRVSEGWTMKYKDVDTVVTDSLTNWIMFSVIYSLASHILSNKQAYPTLTSTVDLGEN